MPKRTGYFVEWVAGDGHCQKGQVFYDEQKPGFKNFDKIFIHLVNDDFTDRIGEGGKKEVALKNIADCNVIGYFD